MATVIGSTIQTGVTPTPEQYELSKNDPQRIPCTLHISNVPAQADEDDIHCVFYPFGPIRIVKLARRSDRMTFAFVEFSAPASATLALGTPTITVLGVPVQCSAARSAIVSGKSFVDDTGNLRPPAMKRPRENVEVEMPAKQPRIEGEPGCSIYVGNVPPSIVSHQLRHVFSVIGRVTKIRMCGDARHATRYAFVDFVTAGEAERAVNLVNDLSLGGSRLRVTPAKNPNTSRVMIADDAPLENVLRTVHVSNIDPSTTSQEVERWAGGAGRVTQVADARRSDATKNWVCLIEYIDIESAALACTALSGQSIGNCTTPVNVDPSATSLLHGRPATLAFASVPAAVAAPPPPTSGYAQFSGAPQFAGQPQFGIPPPPPGTGPLIPSSSSGPSFRTVVPGTATSFAPNFYANK